MKVFKKIVDLQNALFEERKQGKEIGLVPTMGALHEGHASLVRRSVSENGVTVGSVFVNPTQVNDKNDLKNYPHFRLIFFFYDFEFLSKFHLCGIL